MVGHRVAAGRVRKVDDDRPGGRFDDVPGVQVQVAETVAVRGERENCFEPLARRFGDGVRCADALFDQRPQVTKAVRGRHARELAVYPARRAPNRPDAPWFAARGGQPVEAFDSLHDDARPALDDRCPKDLRGGDTGRPGCLLAGDLAVRAVTRVPHELDDAAGAVFEHFGCAAASEPCARAIRHVSSVPVPLSCE